MSCVGGLIKASTFISRIGRSATSAGSFRPEALGDVLVPLRGTQLGGQRVDEVKLCLVPISTARILEPWSVAGSVVLSERR